MHRCVILAGLLVSHQKASKSFIFIHNFEVLKGSHFLPKVLISITVHFKTTEVIFHNEFTL